MRKWFAMALLTAMVALPLAAQDSQEKKSAGTSSSPGLFAETQPAAATLFAAPAGAHRGWALAGPPRATPFAPAAPAAPGLADESEGSLGRVVPREQVFIGYTLHRLNPGGAFPGFNVHGGGGDLEIGLSRWVGLVADIGGGRTHRSAAPGDPPVNLFTYLFGPRISLRKWDRVVPFGELLLGGVNASPGFNGKLPPGYQSFGMAAGGGVDYIFKPYFGWRMFRADYLFSNFSGPLLNNSRQNNFRISTGPIFRFGVTKPVPPPPPNQPPVASCSLTPVSVYAGSGDAVAVHVAASDPDNDSLSYSYTVSGGSVEGSGPDVHWTTTGLAVGTYTLSGKVDDGKGGNANCAATLKIEERPNRPPVISCSAERSPILQGETTKLTAIASDPDNDPVTVTWKTTGGQINGSGSTVEFDAKGVQPGSYTATCGASDGRGGTAENSTVVEVRYPPQVAQLEVRLALHSIYFPTAQPTVAKPNGGLLASQQKTLVSLADDFKKYLTYKPDAHLILQGHADVRGGTEYNQLLSERRVNRTKSVLVAQGVPEVSIESRALGKGDNLTSDQVKQLIQDNPDLQEKDRQKILKNLMTIVWANNRRVDVTLSTTGQQSIRRYPFNAEDALTLISPKGGAGQKAAAAPTPAPKKAPAKKQ